MVTIGRRIGNAALSLDHSLLQWMNEICYIYFYVGTLYNSCPSSFLTGQWHCSYQSTCTWICIDSLTLSADKGTCFQSVDKSLCAFTGMQRHSRLVWAFEGPTRVHCTSK
jgi:hypothetical protein